MQSALLERVEFGLGIVAEKDVVMGKLGTLRRGGEGPDLGR